MHGGSRKTRGSEHKERSRAWQLAEGAHPEQNGQGQQATPIRLEAGGGPRRSALTDPVAFPCAAKLAVILAGVSPAGGYFPVATVVIPSGVKGNRHAGSLGVKVSVGSEMVPGQIRQGGEQVDRL